MCDRREFATGGKRMHGFEQEPCGMGIVCPEGFGCVGVVKGTYMSGGKEFVEMG